MRWHLIALFVISFTVRCSNPDLTPLNPTAATVATPDPAEQIKVDVPECATGNWWDEVDTYSVQPVAYEERCITGVFLTDIEYGEMRLPDGCNAHELRVEYFTNGVHIGTLDRPDYSEGGTLYGYEFDAQGRETMELGIGGGQPEWIKYETWTAFTDTNAPKVLVGNGDKYTVIVDDPEDGVFPSKDRLFNLADIMAKSGTPVDNDGLKTQPDYSACTMRVDIAVEDGSIWPPDAAPYLDPTCDELVVHAKSADGLHTLVGSYGLDYNDVPRYDNWTEEWYSGMHVVKRSRVLVNLDGNTHVEYIDEFAYNDDGELTMHSHHSGADGVKYVETYEYEGNSKYRYVSTYQSFPTEPGQEKPSLYLIQKYHDKNLVKVDGYRSGSGDAWDFDPKNPVLNGYRSSTPQWRYKVDYDASGRKTKEEIYWDAHDIAENQPTEWRVTEYDAQGHLIHDKYHMSPNRGLLSEIEFISNLGELHGWDHYYEYDDKDRLIRKTIDGPPGVSRFWFDFKYHCD